MTLPKFKKIGLESYKPGASKLSRFRNIIKLSANESALGTSPKVKSEINKKINFSKYPDSKSKNLRLNISKNLVVILKKLFVVLDLTKLFKLFANYF